MNNLKSKFHYIPLTKQSVKQYGPQGIFKHGLIRLHVDDSTKGVIYIDENHIVVGYVAVKKLIDGSRKLIRLEVSEEYKGHGYDVDLLEIAVDEFGANTLSINKNDESLQFYLNHGWKVFDDTTPTYILKLDNNDH